MQVPGRLIIVVVALLSIFFMLACIYLPRYTKYDGLQGKETRLTERITYLREEIEKLNREKYLLENDVVYLEKVVREKLGRVEPGETVYKIVNLEEDDGTQSAG